VGVALHRPAAQGGLGSVRLLGIGKADKDAHARAAPRNYRFFDAPVGLIFTIDRVMQQGSWLDYGMFLQNVMVAARARGLDTCPQAAFTQFHRIILPITSALASTQMVVCGMSLGYADPGGQGEHLVTEREPVESGFAQILAGMKAFRMAFLEPSGCRAR
jgi:nitroreductase